MTRQPVLLLATLLLLATAAPAAAQDPAALLAGLEKAYARVNDYAARFRRHEMVGGALRPAEEALLKFQRPDRMYLRWLTGPARGREILFVKGRDDDRMLVREPGSVTKFFTIVMAPDHPRVLQESRHPVTDLGIGRLIELILEHAADARLLEREAPRNGGRERRIEMVWPHDRGERSLYSRMAVTIDTGSGLPVEVAMYDWGDRSVGEYAYRDLRVNPGFAAMDFDPDEYGFPRWRIRK